MSLKQLGRYTLLRPLGEGEMGIVHEAHDPTLDRRVAIKTIRPDRTTGRVAAGQETRFQAEACVGGRLQHPNIIAVHDAGRDAGVAFLVMELVRGSDLKQRLAQGGRLSLEASLRTVEGLLAALGHAHRRGIVHRDVKPANLMLATDGSVKLGDFGVARQGRQAEAAPESERLVGTLHYLSPEQVEGLPLDARADLHAAGVVLYQLLTGHRPFDGPDDAAVLQAIRHRQPEPPTQLAPGLPPAFDALLARALAKDPAARYQTADDFLRALRQAGGPARMALAAIALPGADRRGGPSAGLQRRTVAGEAAPGQRRGSLQGTCLPEVTADPTGHSPPAVTRETEWLHWQAIRASSDPVDFQDFLLRFPAGACAALAARRLRRLDRLLGEGRRLPAPHRPAPVVRDPADVPSAPMAASGPAAPPATRRPPPAA